MNSILKITRMFNRGKENLFYTLICSGLSTYIWKICHHTIVLLTLVLSDKMINTSAIRKKHLLSLNIKESLFCMSFFCLNFFFLLCFSGGMVLVVCYPFIIIVWFSNQKAFRFIWSISYFWMDCGKQQQTSPVFSL